MPSVIETERLLLRLPETSDVHALHRAYCDPDVMRYVGDERPFSKERTAGEIAGFRERWERDWFSAFVLEQLVGGTVIGEVGSSTWDPARWLYGV